MWSAIATLGVALISGVFGLFATKKQAADGLARVQAGTDAEKKVDTSDKGLASDTNNLATHPGN